MDKIGGGVWFLALPVFRPMARQRRLSSRHKLHPISHWKRSWLRSCNLRNCICGATVSSHLGENNKNGKKTSHVKKWAGLKNKKSKTFFHTQRKLRKKTFWIESTETETCGPDIIGGAIGVACPLLAGPSNMTPSFFFFLLCQLLPKKGKKRERRKFLGGSTGTHPELMAPETLGCAGRRVVNCGLRVSSIKKLVPLSCLFPARVYVCCVCVRVCSRRVYVSVRVCERCMTWRVPAQIFRLDFFFFFSSSSSLLSCVSLSALLLLSVPAALPFCQQPAAQAEWLTKWASKRSSVLDGRTVKNHALATASEPTSCCRRTLLLPPTPPLDTTQQHERRRRRRILLLVPPPPFFVGQQCRLIRPTDRPTDRRQIIPLNLSETWPNYWDNRRNFWILYVNSLFGGLLLLLLFGGVVCFDSPFSNTTATITTTATSTISAPTAKGNNK